MSLRLLLISACLCAALGCSSLRTAPVSEDQMVEVLVDFHLASAYLGAVSKSASVRDSLGHGLYPAVLRKHGLTRDKFLEALAYYEQRPKQLEGIYDQVIQQLTVLQQQWSGPQGTTRVNPSSR